MSHKTPEDLESIRKTVEHVQRREVIKKAAAALSGKPVRLEMIVQGLVVTPEGKLNVPAFADALRADGFEVTEVATWVPAREPERFRIKALWPEGMFLNWQKGEA